MSPFELDLLIVGVSPAIFANGPMSLEPSLPDPIDAPSLSSPATKLLNLAQTDPDTFSILGLEIQEEVPSLGDCWSRFVKSSNVVMR
jgi:hypothetical protein